MAVTSFILGIVSLLVAWIPFVGFIMYTPALVSLVLGIVHIVKKKEEKKGLSIAGVILSSLAFFAMFISTIIVVPILSFLPDVFDGVSVEVNDDGVNVDINADNDEYIYIPSFVNNYTIADKIDIIVPDDLFFLGENSEQISFYYGDDVARVSIGAISSVDDLTYDGIYDDFNEAYGVAYKTSINVINGNPWRYYKSFKIPYEDKTGKYTMEKYFMISYDSKTIYVVTVAKDETLTGEELDEFDVITEYLFKNIEITN